MAAASPPPSAAARIRVEPGPQLALLPAREGRDAARVARLALDERERLQDGVVHARCHLGALLRADPGGALRVPLGGQPPGPRPEHEQKCDRDGARLEDGVAAVRGRVLVDEHDHADGGEREADHERGTAAAARQQDPGSAERGRPDQRVREPEAAERDRARERESHIPEQPSAG